MAGNTEPLSPRSRLAVTAGKAAAAVSRAAGRGSGSVIGGKVALRLDPDLLQRLAQHLDVILVSATNGKTTTTRLIAEALRANGEVVSNALGANMPAGITSALAGGSKARYGVIEVDEKYLSGVARDVTPKAIALLNLSRDQLDRAAETRMLAEHWREGLSGQKAVIVANADDPLVVWAASSSPNVVWVAAGQEWKDDAWSCPACGGVMQRPGDDWFCAECGFRRPTPTWALSGDHVLDPHGSAWPIHLQLPGRANKANAATSAAVAAAFGVRAAGRAGADVRGQGRRRTVRRGAVREPGHAAAAGEEPRRVAGDVPPDRSAAHPGHPFGERTRRGRHRHLVAVGRGLRHRWPGTRIPRHRPTGSWTSRCGWRSRAWTSRCARTPRGRRTPVPARVRIETIANYTAFQDLRRAPRRQLITRILGCRAVVRPTHRSAQGDWRHE